MSGNEIEEELEFLSQAAFKYSQKHPSLSRQLLQQFHLKSLEIGVEIISTAYCLQCFTVYIPGGNCQVSTVNTFTKRIFIGKRLQSGKVGERIYYHCDFCDTTTIHALSEKKEEKKEELDHKPQFVIQDPTGIATPIPVKVAPKPSKKAKKKKNLEQLLAKKDLDSKKQPSLSLDDFLNNL
jgi:RNase P subunit RPR2